MLRSDQPSLGKTRLVGMIRHGKIWQIVLLTWHYDIHHRAIQYRMLSRLRRVVTTMTITATRGVIRGSTIELKQPLGLPDGQEVNVIVSATQPETASPLPPGEGLRRAFGAWAADGEELDHFIAWVRQQRKVNRRPATP